MLRLQRAFDIGEIRGLRRREVERQDHRLRMARGDDFVVERFELAFDAAVQHDRRAPPRRRARARAEAAGRARDEDDAIRERATEADGGGQRHAA